LVRLRHEASHIVSLQDLLTGRHDRSDGAAALPGLRAPSEAPNLRERYGPKVIAQVVRLGSKLLMHRACTALQAVPGAGYIESFNASVP
jgi:hypothetical protein